MRLELAWIRDVLHFRKCRGFDCYAILISINLFVTRYYHVVFPPKGAKITNESITQSQTFTFDTVYSLVTFIKNFFYISLHEIFVELFYQQTQSNFAVGLPYDELRCNIMSGVQLLNIFVPETKEAIRPVVNIIV